MRSRDDAPLASWGCENGPIWPEGKLISPGRREKVPWLPSDSRLFALSVHSKPATDQHALIRRSMVAGNTIDSDEENSLTILKLSDPAIRESSAGRQLFAQPGLL